VIGLACPCCYAPVPKRGHRCGACTIACRLVKDIWISRGVCPRLGPPKVSQPPKEGTNTSPAIARPAVGGAVEVAKGRDGLRRDGSTVLL
jgi:hypothetical protein